MSDGVSIKEYPLKVSLSDQKDVISVEQEIKESLELLKTNYGVKDKQDLLAMFLFQYMMANKKSNNDLGDANDGLHEKLKDLEDFVSNYLKS